MPKYGKFPTLKNPPGTLEARLELLNYTPEEVWEDTCRCTGRTRAGWKFLEKRQMWVCGDCEKPSGQNENYVKQCADCEGYFVLEVGTDEPNADGDYVCPYCE